MTSKAPSGDSEKAERSDLGRGTAPPCASEQAEHDALRWRVLERDAYTCLGCGARATEVHHVGSRRHDNAWDVRNMVSLCPRCHAAAGSKVEKARYLRMLRERYGYDYADMGRPWTVLVADV